MVFPLNRQRRFRRTPALRKLFAETSFSASDLVAPLFAIDGKNLAEPIMSMPGVLRYSVDNLIRETEEIYKLGIPAVLIFGVPEKTTALRRKRSKEQFENALYDENGLVQKAVREIKRAIPEIIVMTDVCLCSYTSHGHCGILRNQKSESRSKKKKFNSCQSPIYYEIDNDKTIDILAKIALSHAEAGADIVAPSSMMDGQVKYIREALDGKNFQNTMLMSYSVKYASNFYTPFREAANSKPAFGDRKSYQLDFRNVREALREVESDINEGADIIMVKPAMAYLDVLKEIKNNFNTPLAAYSVSGEYSMVKAASANGWLNEKEVAMEIASSIKRAGADLLITYWAKCLAEWIK